MVADISRDTTSVNDLDTLAAAVRTAHKAAQAAWSNALGHMLDAGDALLEVQNRGVPGSWKRWLRENCLLGVSTAQLYTRLARHRAEIEAALQEDPELSLRAARRLLAKPKSRTSSPKPPIPTPYRLAHSLKNGAYRRARRHSGRRVLCGDAGELARGDGELRRNAALGR